MHFWRNSWLSAKLSATPIYHTLSAETLVVQQATSLLPLRTNFVKALCGGSEDAVDQLSIQTYDLSLNKLHPAGSIGGIKAL